MKELQDYLKAIEMIALTIEKHNYAEKGDGYIPNSS